MQHCKHGSDLDIYSRQGHFQPDSFRALLEWVKPKMTRFITPPYGAADIEWTRRYSSRANKEELSFWDALG